MLSSPSYFSSVIISSEIISETFSFICSFNSSIQDISHISLCISLYHFTLSIFCKKILNFSRSLILAIFNLIFDLAFNLIKIFLDISAIFSSCIKDINISDSSFDNSLFFHNFLKIFKIDFKLYLLLFFNTNLSHFKKSFDLINSSQLVQIDEISLNLKDLIFLSNLLSSL